MPAFPLAIDACTALLQEQNGSWEEVAWGFLPEPGSWIGGTGRDELWLLSPEFDGVAAALHRTVRVAAAQEAITDKAEWDLFVRDRFETGSRYVTAPTVGLGPLSGLNGYAGAGPASPLVCPDRVMQLDTGSIGLYSPAGSLIGAVHTGETSDGSQRTETWLLGSEYDPLAPPSEAVVMKPYSESYASAPDFLAAFRQDPVAANWEMVMVQNVYSNEAPS